jgi:hypothetical protein
MKFIIFCLLLCCSVLPAFSQAPITGLLQICAGSTIRLANIVPGGTWTVDNSAIATINGFGVLQGISVGMVNVTYTVAAGQSTEVVTVTPRPQIAVDSCTFLGAVYSNFTGIPDDNPGGFTSTYLRLSHSIFQPEGIADKAKFNQRWIALRNFMFELSYNNNNSNLKMYSLDTFGSKYSNRLDLYTHSYFSGSLYVNLLTFVLPKYPHLFNRRSVNDSNRHMGDGAHLYLDVLTNLSIANVIDTGKSSEIAPITYSVKTAMYGLGFKYKTTNGVSKTPFNIELGLQLFWLYTSSNSINSNLNAPYNSIGDINNLQNRSKTVLASSSNIYPYLALNVLIEYNTNPGNSSSNIFIHYRYIDNYIADFSTTHYHNNFFEFQLGYALDLGKLLAK